MGQIWGASDTCYAKKALDALLTDGIADGQLSEYESLDAESVTLENKTKVLVSELNRYGKPECAPSRVTHSIGLAARPEGPGGTLAHEGVAAKLPRRTVADRPELRVGEEGRTDQAYLRELGCVGGSQRHGEEHERGEGRMRGWRPAH